MASGAALASPASLRLFSTHALVSPADGWFFLFIPGNIKRPGRRFCSWGWWLLPVLLPLGLFLLAPGFTRVFGFGFGCLALLRFALCGLGFGLLLLGLDGFDHLGFDVRLFFARLLLAVCPFGCLHLS